MKKLLFIAALFLIPFCGFSQTTKPIEGFLGIKFGSSKADVITAVKAKGGHLLESSTDELKRFVDVSLGHRPSVELRVYFVNDKAYFATFYFQPENDPKAIDYYNALVNDVSEIYGNGKPLKEFKSPFKDGDGEEITALEGSYATFSTTWASEKKTVQAGISVIDHKLYVTLMYQDDNLQAEHIAQQKAKEKSDF